MTGPQANRRDFLATAALSVMLSQATGPAAALPATGARWQFFDPGTLRPATVFADSELRKEIGSQVAYDQNGLPPFFLDPKRNYRAVLLQADGTVLADIDPLTDPVQGLLFFVPTGPNGSIRPLQEHAKEVVTFGDHANLDDSQAAIDRNEEAGRGIAVRGRSAGIVRSLQNLMSEGISLTKDFPVTEGQLSTAGIKNAINTAASDGFTLYVPGGQFRFDEPIEARLDGPINKPTGMRKAAVHGDGANVTEFLYMGSPDENALSFEATSFPNISNLRLQGFRVHRPDHGRSGVISAQGAGIVLTNVVQYSLDDIQSFRHGIGVLIIGCLRGRVRDFAFTYNRINMRLSRGQHTDTNVLRISGGSLNAGLERGLQALGGAQIHISDFTIHGTGLENPQPETARGFEFSRMGANGGVAAHIDHGYFEANRGVEIEIVPGPWPANYAITNCNFNRIGPNVAERPSAGIRFSGDLAGLKQGGPKSLLDLSGSAFDGYDTGEGYRVDPTHPYLDIRLPNGADALTLLDRAARYGHAREIGRIPPDVNRNP